MVALEVREYLQERRSFPAINKGGKFFAYPVFAQNHKNQQGMDQAQK